MHAHRPGRPERLPVFVYGTLRPGEVNHARYLRGRTAAEEPARLYGALLYEGPGYPYAVTAPEDPAGPTGASGTLGPSGALGPSGPSGSSGALGPSGPSGSSDTLGPSGALSPSGPSAGAARLQDAPVPGAGIAGDLVHPLAEYHLPLLTVLDRLENFHGPGHPDNDYERVVREVRLSRGGTVRAWVYLAADAVARRLRTAGTPFVGADGWRSRPPLTSAVPPAAPAAVLPTVPAEIPPGLPAALSRAPGRCDPP